MKPSHDRVVPTSLQFPVSNVSFGAPDACTGSPIGPPPLGDGLSGVLNHGQVVSSYRSVEIEPAHGPISPPNLPG